jgi:hypothetical protein
MSKVVKELTCDCGGNSFTIQMRYDKKDEMRLLLCHDGYGFEFEDAFWKCNKCGKVIVGCEGTWEDKVE